jgi:hypothetical protein
VVRTLFSLYIRAGVGVANLTLRVAARSAELAADAVRLAIPSTAQPVHGDSEDVFAEAVEPATQPPPEIDYAPAPPEGVDETTAPPGQPEPASDRAKTIDDEPELVAELAEPGAEEGASAEVEVDEPWDGYDDLSADEVIARIGEADSAAVGVVELYERSHKQRRTVITAVERRQRELANAAP